MSCAWRSTVCLNLLLLTDFNILSNIVLHYYFPFTMSRATYAHWNANYVDFGCSDAVCSLGFIWSFRWIQHSTRPRAHDTLLSTAQHCNIETLYLCNRIDSNRNCWQNLSNKIENLLPRMRLDFAVFVFRIFFSFVFFQFFCFFYKTKSEWKKKIIFHTMNIHGSSITLDAHFSCASGKIPHLFPSFAHH